MSLCPTSAFYSYIYTHIFTYWYYHLSLIGYVSERLRLDLATSIKRHLIENIEEKIIFENWIGTYLSRQRSCHVTHKQYSVRSRRSFRNSNEILYCFITNEVRLRRREDVKMVFIGRDDNRGMQSLFINGETYFLPPPLNKFVGLVLCENRELTYERLAPYLHSDNSDPVIQRIQLESSPFFRLLSSMIQKDYFYAVDQ